MSKHDSQSDVSAGNPDKPESKPGVIDDILTIVKATAPHNPSDPAYHDALQRLQSLADDQRGKSKPS